MEVNNSEHDACTSPVILVMVHVRTHVCVCACVRACVCARARVHACVCNIAFVFKQWGEVTNFREGFVFLGTSL